MWLCHITIYLNKRLPYYYFFRLFFVYSIFKSNCWDTDSLERKNINLKVKGYADICIPCHSKMQNNKLRKIEINYIYIRRIKEKKYMWMHINLPFVAIFKQKRRYRKIFYDDMKNVDLDGRKKLNITNVEKKTVQEFPQLQDIIWIAYGTS